jgi:DNA-binding LacI/PurR family transcriptional regulator
MLCNCCVTESKRISLRDIAAEAKVDRATVSRALRNHPGIPPETRHRIQEIARRLNYRVNPLVSTVMSHARTVGKETYVGTLAYLTAWPTRSGWHDVATDRRYFAGASARAGQSGYRLEEFWLKEPRMTARRMCEVLEARGITGLILAPLPFPPARGHLSLDLSRFAAVTLGYSVWRPNLDRVVSHHGNNVVRAVHELRRLGYRRIGLALREGLDEREDRNIVVSFRFAQQAMAAANRLPVMLIGAHGKRDFARWVQFHRPDAVISFGGPAWQWLRDLGLAIPAGVAYVELDLPDTSGACAGIDQHPEALAATVVDLLVAQLHRNELGVPALPKLMLIEGTWIPGATVRAQKP